MGDRRDRHKVPISTASGNVLRSGGWDVATSGEVEIISGEVDVFRFVVVTGKPVYLVSGGGSDDFQALDYESGSELMENSVIRVNSVIEADSYAGVEIILLTYGVDRRRLGQFVIPANRLAKISVSPEIKYVLPTLRVGGPNEVAVKALSVNVEPGPSSAQGSVIEYGIGVADNSIDSSLQASPNAGARSSTAFDPRLASAAEAIASYYVNAKAGAEPGNGIAGCTSRFSPQRIQATEIKAKPSAQKAGRIAAEQIMVEETQGKLRELLSASDISGTRVIAGVAGQDLAERVGKLGRYLAVHPGQSARVIPEDTAYVIVDEEAFASGVWAGADNAGSSDWAMQLIELMKAGRRIGSVNIFVGRHRSAHYTSSFKALADIVVEDGKSDLQWEDDVLLPVFTEILNQTREQ